MNKPIIAAVAVMVFINTSSQTITPPQPQAAQPSLVNTLQDPPKCIRWTWTGDVYNRTVVCLEWRKKDPDRERKK
jgi:hypothetical protein